ncbi:protein-glutamate methylesterase/protein-glutamine glutaminase [Alteromonas lipolytica]|uniref:Protein-glutamate methylesterase/protein-glutamine glutaminase n=1 Tax=Alteromonas lipolytica TaxID=1856405 RepID=A0A1E8FFE4_9ALTE|nr:chemotaxis response regulator protein-glutamate methylesterase [Alteromonas lipolytica]OFI34630.1 chemotaxis response regulator protein-glutamate methylesterase [Alteromonas lipolytica]GGF52672.1 chemotaxis response regulator protein-glutamate methylesterase of group 1 operon [Alteromonas lipolytica]
MTFKVLIVDDSSFYRRRVKDILDQDRSLEVVGEAADGKEAVQKVKSLRPDVVTMDVEMPLMDGIEAVKRIMAECPVSIIMFSSLTHEGAKATLDALEAGAVDFLPKRFEDIAKERSDAATLLRTKVRLLARRAPIAPSRPKPATTTGLLKKVPPPPARKMPANAPKSTFVRSSTLLSGSHEATEPVNVSHVQRSGKRYRCLAIGASTGGPVALQKVLTHLPERFPFPVFLVQHMPGTFTHAFAERLNQNCRIKVKEAEHGEAVVAGCAYLAPGGKQMEIEKRAGQAYIAIREVDPADIGYKPSVDITFNSLSHIYGGDTLAVILTGMGADGREGCRTLKSLGGKIWAQDKDSSVVYGMPQAVTVDKLAEVNIDIDAIGQCILTEMS